MMALRQTPTNLASGGHLKAWSVLKVTGSCDKALIVVLGLAGGQNDFIFVHVHLHAQVHVLHLDLDIVFMFDKGPFGRVFGARKDGNVVTLFASIATSHTPQAVKSFFLPKITYKG
jgi:hypothetical protein